MIFDIYMLTKQTELRCLDEASQNNNPTPLGLFPNNHCTFTVFDAAKKASFLIIILILIPKVSGSGRTGVKKL